MLSLKCHALLLLAFIAGAVAQQCQPSLGILKLAGVDQNCLTAGAAVQECTNKMQMTVSSMCSVQLQPDLAVAADGTFCSPSTGALQRDNAAGKLALGRSDLVFTMRAQPRAGLVLMNLRGRIVPPTGGREFPVDCNLAFNVTGGSAMGIVSTGTDSLMSTTVQPALAGVGFGGSGVPGQQNGMNGAMNRLPGPQAESGNQEGNQKKRSSAGSVLGSMSMACMAGFMGLLLPALL